MYFSHDFLKLQTLIYIQSWLSPTPFMLYFGFNLLLDLQPFLLQILLDAFETSTVFRLPTPAKLYRRA